LDSESRDFNGDGTAEILWRNSAGQIDLWFVNGLSIVGQGPSAPWGWSGLGPRGAPPGDVVSTHYGRDMLKCFSSSLKCFSSFGEH
jgi:hypothetical protein